MPACLQPKDYKNGRAYPCGKCDACRDRIKVNWANKLMLEAAVHENSSFVTLTYSDEHIPYEGELQSLRFDDIKEYLSSLHAVIRSHDVQDGPGDSRFPREFRYIAVGEYGERTQRPHYHAMFFGLHWYDTWLLTESLWKKGFIQCVPVIPARCSYIAGYTVKGNKERGSFRKVEKMPDGRERVSHSYSRQPALGSEYLGRVVRYYQTRKGSEDLAREGDIRHTWRHKGYTHAFSDYQKRIMRRSLGLPETFKALNQIRPDLVPPEDPFQLDKICKDADIWERRRVRKMIYAQKTQRI